MDMGGLDFPVLEVNSLKTTLFSGESQLVRINHKIKCSTNPLKVCNLKVQSKSYESPRSKKILVCKKKGLVITCQRESRFLQL